MLGNLLYAFKAGSVCKSKCNKRFQESHLISLQIIRSIDLLQLERLTKLSEQGKLISGAPIIYIDLPSHLSLVLELPRQYSHYALCYTLLLNQSVRDKTI